MRNFNAVEGLRGSLKRARKAACALRRDSGDEGGLHGFRVALRRLLVLLRDYGELLGLPKKIRRNLRGTLKTTAATREYQVQRRWLGDSPLIHSRAPRLDPALWPRFERTAVRLDRALEAVPVGRSSLRKAGVKAARRRHRQLTRRLKRLDVRLRGRALHKARIGVKRLRYLLESLPAPPAGLPAIPALKRLQSTLGDIHDRDVISENLAALSQERENKTAAAREFARLKREKRMLLRRARTQWGRLNQIEG